MSARIAVMLTAALVLVVSASAAAQVAPGGTFIDDDGTTHEGAIEALVAADVTAGCDTDGPRFCPAAAVTRAEMAVLLLRAIGHDGHLPGHHGRFTDVPAGHWAAGFVEHLAEHAITSGCGDGFRYCPDAPVSRAQMAAFVVAAFDLPPSDVDAFGDDDGLRHEASANALAAAGISDGCGGRRFCPDQVTSRAEVAAFISRAMGLAPIVPPPGFYGEINPIDAKTRARMTHSWREGCPVPLSQLRLLRLDHWDFAGRERRGELVVHAAHAGDVLTVFESLFDAGFPIARMELVDAYGGDDNRSMAANNTSAFNCRRVTGGSSWSEHSYGAAIDVNPVQNPYVRGSTVLPEAGRRYLDRSRDAPGMIHAGDVVVDAFAAIGWGWGGDFVNLQDYQHFSATGR